MTATQIRLLCHAIGYEPGGSRLTRRRVYSAYRNYFAAPNGGDIKWDRLVRMGYAVAHGVQQPGGYYYYNVSRKGMVELEKIYAITIEESR